MRQVFDSFAGFDDFLAYLAVALVLLALFVAIYIRVTPYREIALIREGNMAAMLLDRDVGAAVALSTSLRAVAHNPLTMAIWGVIAMLIQLAAFVAVKLTIPSISRDIPADRAAHGFFLGAVSIAVGILNAACMSY